MCINLLKMSRKTLKNQRFFVSRKFYKFSKTSQINMLETIVVLAVFFILVVFVFIFYFKVSENNAETQKEENTQLNAIKIAQKASFLPELQCSQDNVAVENCIDLLKLAAISDIIKENEIHYFDAFSFSRITINEIYPDVEELVVIYDKPLEEYSNKIVSNIPISLFNPLNNKNSFGVMVVEVFSK